MARQGGRLRDPGPRRGAGPADLGQPFGRGRPAPVRNARPARARRAATWLSGSTKRASARTAPSWSRTDGSSKRRSNCPATSRSARCSTLGWRRSWCPAGARSSTLADGREALLEPLPPKLTEGQALRVEIVREAIPEPGRAKLPKARPPRSPRAPGQTLLERIKATGLPVVTLAPPEPDRLEARRLVRTARGGADRRDRLSPAARCG